MPEIDRYRPEDQRGVEALYRRVFGPDAAAASRLRWDWQYRRNPNNPERRSRCCGSSARDRRSSATTRRCPCACRSAAKRFRRRGEPTRWSRPNGSGAASAKSCSARGTAASAPRSDWACPALRRALLKKMHFPDVAPIPGLVKPLTRRAVRMPQWPMTLNRFVSAVTLPIVRVAARVRPLRADVEPIRRFDASFTDLWERLADRFELAVRRDAAYLNWKFIEPPHVRYSVAALKRDGRPEGYAVYRHVQEPRGRVTLLVDFLADTHDEIGFKTLLRWVDAEARAGRVGQDSLLRRAPRVPAHHAAFGLLPDEVEPAGAGGRRSTP